MPTFNNYVLQVGLDSGVVMNTEIDFSSEPVIASNSRGHYGVPNSPLTRVFDVALILIAAPYILFFFLVISILIMLDSKGGVIYGQTRIGKGGRRFKAYKFRTMILNADQLLQHYLDASPELK